MTLIYIRKKISGRHFISQVKYDGHFAFILLTVMPQKFNVHPGIGNRHGVDIFS